MSETLKTMFLMLLFAGIIAMQYNGDADRTSNRQIKNALELAVHDAALAIDSTQLSQGLIVFDKVEAKNNLKTSIEQSLRVSSPMGIIYTPDKNSFFQEDIMIEHLEFIDDSNTSNFPMIYTNAKYDIVEIMNGPGIIAVISTRSPRYFVGNKSIIRKAVVYEYNK